MRNTPLDSEHEIEEEQYPKRKSPVWNKSEY
jgi:hypothetical protein